jgi:hypothetical protein
MALNTLHLGATLKTAPADYAEASQDYVNAVKQLRLPHALIRAPLTYLDI